LPLLELFGDGESGKDSDSDEDDDENSDNGGDSGEDEETSLFSGASPTPDGSVYENGVDSRGKDDQGWWSRLVGGGKRNANTGKYRAVQ
jgi:hypothetical protein